MGNRSTSLLCELHAHTTWSDGSLSLADLVDLYGRNGFDVLCVTDHCIRADDPCQLSSPEPLHVHAGNHDDYLKAIDREAARARSLYGLLVIPGLELTYDDVDPRQAAHAVAVGLRRFVGLENGLDVALAEARGAGAALIAAHPYALSETDESLRRTARFAESWRELAPAVDRFELFNRHELFGWVAAARLPVVATGDFHLLEHLGTWKTLIPCRKDEGSVIDHLRSGRAVHLTRVEAAVKPLAA
jgi:PHP domain